jgi:hypothetical protein
LANRDDAEVWPSIHPFGIITTNQTARGYRAFWDSEGFFAFVWNIALRQFHRDLSQIYRAQNLHSPLSGALDRSEEQQKEGNYA